MIPERLDYAKALAIDLANRKEGYSSGVVESLLQERADLLAACESAEEELRSLLERGHAVSALGAITTAIARAKQ